MPTHPRHAAAAPPRRPGGTGSEAGAVRDLQCGDTNVGWARVVSLESATRRIADVTGAPPEAVRSRLHDECRDLGVNVRRDLSARGIAPHVWSERLLQFYVDSDAFFYELVVWNRSREKRRQRAWIRRMLRRKATVNTILVYGDGLGFDGTFFSRAGYRVTCFDLSPRYRRFAEGVFAEASVDVEWVDREESLDGREFDAIICLDVLEHVPDPPAVVGRLAGMLRPDGLLVVHAPFWLLDASTRTHLRSNLTYAGDRSRLYTAHGLSTIDCRPMWNPVVVGRAAASRSHGAWPGRLRCLLGQCALRLARLLPGVFSRVCRMILSRDIRAGSTADRELTGWRPRPDRRRA